MNMEGSLEMLGNISVGVQAEAAQEGLIGTVVNTVTNTGGSIKCCRCYKRRLLKKS
jgi:hypothetical protein